MAVRERQSSVRTDQRPEFVQTDFAQLIRDQGQKIVWSKAMLCPNRDPTQSEHHRVNCSVCDDNGYVYFDPIDTRAAVYSFSGSQVFQQAMHYERGQIYITPMPEDQISYFDKITLTESTARYSEVIKLSTALSYALRYTPIKLVRVHTNKDAVVAAATYSISGGSIAFTAVPTGEFVVVSYTYRPVYIVQDLMHQIRDTRATVQDTDVMVRMPIQAVAKLDWLITAE